MNHTDLNLEKDGERVSGINLGKQPSRMSSPTSPQSWHNLSLTRKTFYMWANSNYLNLTLRFAIFLKSQTLWQVTCASFRAILACNSGTALGEHRLLDLSRDLFWDLLWLQIFHAHRFIARPALAVPSTVHVTCAVRPQATSVAARTTWRCR